jgi:hypothetical protein
MIALIILVGSEVGHAGQWQLVRNDDTREIRAYLRTVPDSEYKSFYATTRVKASLSSIVAVLSDVPAMPEWIARMRSAQLLRREANREIWVHGIYKLPYPFLEREAVLHSVLTQGKKGVIEVTTRAVGGYINNHPKRVRLMNMYSIWRLTPEKNGIVKIELWGQGDPGGYVPPLLFNYNLPDEPVQILRNLRQMLMREKYRQRRLEYIQDA